MNELQRSIWLLSILMNAEKNRAMPEFTKVEYQTSNRKCAKMFEFLAECDLFHIDTVRINLNSGEVADESVNVFQAQAIGESLIQGVVGSSAFDYKFKKKDMAIIIKTKVSFNIEDSVVEDDPRLFFQRLIVFIETEEINDTFNYELCILFIV